jgi:DedD protein
MEIKGDEFLKNVQKKQEEESLRKRLNEFEQQRQQQSQSNPYEEQNHHTNDQELSDILLNSNKPDNEQNNKKKYVMLAIALALLFVITLVIIRLLSSDEGNVAFEESSAIQQDKVLDNEKIQQEYQQILNEKLKKVDAISTAPASQEPQQEQENPLAIEDTNEAQPSTQEVIEPKVTPQEPIKKEVAKPAQTTQSQSKQTTQAASKPVQTTAPLSTAAQGVFIQIGAFSKKPNNDYLSNISKKGYNFKLYDTTVNSKQIVKVLVGPYKSRNEANSELEKVKKAFEVPGAYILQL